MEQLVKVAMLLAPQPDILTTITGWPRRNVESILKTTFISEKSMETESTFNGSELMNCVRQKSSTLIMPKEGMALTTTSRVSSFQCLVFVSFTGDCQD